MPEPKTLRDLFVDELRDAYDSERQLVKALRQMARAASNPALEAAFTAHMEETVDQVSVLEGIFEMLDLKPRGKHCAGTAGIIEESKDAISELDTSPLLDVALVAGARRAEHYEMASYLGLIDMARALGLDAAAKEFQSILDQETAADQKLEGLAEQLLSTALNADANAEEAEGEDGEESKPRAGKKASGRKVTAKRS